jgi:hypothetical protein
MSEARPGLGLKYPASCPDDDLQLFVEDMAASGVLVSVRREERGPQAGLEDWLPTLAALFIAKAFFDGLLKEAGKDAYAALRRGVARFWPVFFGKNRKVRVHVEASASNKLGAGVFSRAFSVLAPVPDGTIKLALRDDATAEELSEAVELFLPLLERVFAGEEPPLKYLGGVALVAYDRDKKRLWFPTLEDGVVDPESAGPKKLRR